MMFSTAAMLFSVGAQTPTTSVLFKSFEEQPGKVLVIRSSTDASGGQITVNDGTSVKKGTVSVKRNRMYERRVVGTGLMQKLEYTVLEDKIHRSAKMGGKSDVEDFTGSLVGKVVYGIRDDMARWRLFLKGGTATTRQAADLIQIESYENRQWFQQTPVKVGDTWPINPQFIRNFIERDMGPSIIKATMSFKSIQVIDGERTAVLEVKINTQARREGLNKTRVASVIANLEGTLYVALDTMLDKKLTMAGTLHTIMRRDGVVTITKSPVTYIVIKSVR